MTWKNNGGAWAEDNVDLQGFCVANVCFSLKSIAFRNKLIASQKDSFFSQK